MCIKKIKFLYEPKLGLVHGNHNHCNENIWIIDFFQFSNINENKILLTQ